MNKDATITIRLPEQDKEALKAIATKKDMPISQLIRVLVKNYIREAE